MLLFGFLITIIANGFKNRKTIKIAEFFQYAWFVITIIAVIIFLLDNIKIQQLWEVLK